MRMVSNPQMIGEAEPACAEVANADSAIAQVTNLQETNAPVASPPASGDSRSPPHLDPTRYGDWERNGRCIDF